MSNIIPDEQYYSAMPLNLIVKEEGLVYGKEFSKMFNEKRKCIEEQESNDRRCKKTGK